MVRSSKRSGHSPFKAVMLGSSPARITILGYCQEVKAPVFDTGTAGSNPAIPAMIRYSRGSRGQSAKLLVAGSNPARISIWCLRLIGQDTSLSSWQYGFESRRHHHIWVSRLAAMAVHCKCTGFILRWFESNLAHHIHFLHAPVCIARF